MTDLKEAAPNSLVQPLFAGPLDIVGDVHGGESPSNQFCRRRPSRKTAEGAVATDAERVWHIRRQGLNPAKPAKMD